MLVLGVGGQEEVIGEEQVSDDGVEVDENDCQQRGQQDGLDVLCDTADHVAEGVVPHHHVEELCVCVCVCVYV